MNTKSDPPAIADAKQPPLTADAVSSDGVVADPVSTEGVGRDRAHDANPSWEDLDPTTDSKEADVESWLAEAARVEPPKQAILPSVGQVVAGKYRIQRELGRGGMGAVYQAEHLISHKQVALKWMLRSGLDDRAKQRFTREAQAAGRISHPNVVDVYDIGEESHACFLVMELLRGESLRRRLSNGPLPVTEAIDLLVPAMRGVAAAHQQGVIHRDLKPDNIFLCTSSDGTPREAKVLDFGISTINNTELGAQHALTHEGTILGTPAYMSAEQLENPRSVDQRADVHALGVILYEALTGHLPFDGGTHNALMLAIVKNQPQPLTTWRQDLPEGLEAVVLSALGPKRFTSVNELIEALLPFGSDPAPEISVLPDAPTPKRRVSRGALALGLVLLALAAVWFMSRGTTPQAAPQSGESKATAAAAAPQQAAPKAQRPATPPPAPQATTAGDTTEPASVVPASTATAIKATPATQPAPRPERATTQRAPQRLPTPAKRSNQPGSQRPGRTGTISADEL